MAQRLNTVAAFPISAIPAAATSPAPAGLSAECAGLLVEPAGLLGPRKPHTRVAAPATMPTTVLTPRMVASQLRGGPSQFMASGVGLVAVQARWPCKLGGDGWGRRHWAAAGCDCR